MVPGIKALRVEIELALLAVVAELSARLDAIVANEVSRDLAVWSMRDHELMLMAKGLKKGTSGLIILFKRERKVTIRLRYPRSAAATASPSPLKASFPPPLMPVSLSIVLPSPPFSE